MSLKTSTLFTATLLSLVFCGFSRTSVLAKASQEMPSPSIEVGLDSTETLIALNQPTDISQADALTPTGYEQNIPGIISAYNNSIVQIKLADGTSQRYQLNPNIVNSPNLRRGAFISLLIDENQIVQEVQPAQVERVTEGIVREVVGNRVMLELPNGQIETTTVAPPVSARMGLRPGVPLVVTSYQGISSTKLCIGQTTPPPLPVSRPPVIENPQPIGGGDVPPIRGLW